MHKKKVEHMARRRAHGMTHKELGEEFGVSRQQAGRLLRRKTDDEERLHEEE